MPEAIFEDIIQIQTDYHENIEHEIDKIFLSVCEENSVMISSLVPSSPCLFGGYVQNEKIYINFKDSTPEFITLKISGTRKDRKDRRFPIFSAEEAQKNNQFWDSWKK
jgi:hypothetical protein